MKYLLLQVRNPDDPMRAQEVDCFARCIACAPESIHVLDLLTEELTRDRLRGFAAVFIGGSGHYSACGSEPWLMRTLEGLQRLFDADFPLFASCWGFQALARAMGGRVINDPEHAEIGTHSLFLTEAGKRDPLFGRLPDTFLGQMGHEDHVVELPPHAVRLASTERVANQSYTFPGKPIYATQFHTELLPSDLKQRVEQYPEYLELVTGLTVEEFNRQTRETPEVAGLIGEFVSLFVSPRRSPRRVRQSPVERSATKGVRPEAS